jgi:4-hydroxy-3-methylbut-2-enyl diphosphate reductase IspH
MESFAPDKPKAQKPQLRLRLASPRGVCAGVERAIRIVECHHAAGRHILPIGYAGHPEAFNVPRALAS